MAYSYTGGDVMSGSNVAKISIKETDVNIANNTSVVTATLTIGRTDYASYPNGSYDSSASNNVQITINGVKKTWTVKQIGGNVSSNGMKTYTHSVTVTHNSDGSKSIGVSASGGLSGTSYGKFSIGTITATLEKIPRYANISAFNATLTQTSSACSVAIDWAADSSCKAWSYTLDGSTYTSVSMSTAGTTASTTINLAPGKTYSVGVKVTRNDSSLETTSSQKSITTKPIPTLTFANTSFTIGNNITATVNDYANNSCSLKAYLLLENSGEYSTSTLVSTTVSNSASYTINFSSVASTIYAQTIKKTSTNIKVVFEATVNGTLYSNTYILKASVDKDSNLPTFGTANFNFVDTSTLQTVLGNNVYMVKGRGAMKSTISTHASTKNSATISKYRYSLYKSDNTSVYSSEKTCTSTTSSLVIDLTSACNNLAAGSYYLAMAAVDSRGYSSAGYRKDFTILDYHLPTQSISINRYNGFEKEIELSFSSSRSILSIGGTDKNANNYTVKYRYKDTGTSTWGSWSELSGFTTSTSGNDYKYTKTQNAQNSFFINDLDISKSYNFEFTVQDAVCLSDGSNVSIPLLIGQGIPIFMECDNGYVTIAKTPDFSNTISKLQVGTDINALGINVATSLQNLIYSNKTISDNAIDGSLWFDTSTDSVSSSTAPSTDSIAQLVAAINQLNIPSAISFKDLYYDSTDYPSEQLALKQAVLEGNIRNDGVTVGRLRRGVYSWFIANMYSSGQHGHILWGAYNGLHHIGVYNGVFYYNKISDRSTTTV